MPDKDARQPQARPAAGAAFDKNRFMYEVADEIRSGLDESKKKTAPGQGYETTRPFEKEPEKKTTEFKKEGPEKR